MEFSSLQEAFRDPSQGFNRYTYDPVIPPQEVEVLHPDQQEMINRQAQLLAQQREQQTQQAQGYHQQVYIDRNLRDEINCAYCGRRGSRNSNTILIIIIIFLVFMLMRK